MLKNIKIVIMLCFLSICICSCQNTSRYMLAYQDSILYLYDNGKEVMQLSGKDKTWEKKVVISRCNENVYSGGVYQEEYENKYCNESRIEPIYLIEQNIIYYVYENEDGIMFFCYANIDSGENEGIYAEEISDSDLIYDIKKQAEEVSFIHMVYHNGDSYENIIKTKIGNDYAVVETNAILR